MNGVILMAQKKYKDPKVAIVSIEEYFNCCDYFCDFTKSNVWDDSKTPEPGRTYYKITHEYLIIICYGLTFANFGMDIREKLEKIIVAYRDGETEYVLLKNKLNELSLKRHTQKNLEQIKKIEKVMEKLPEFKRKSISSRKPFEDYLIQTGYKTSSENLKDKYIVFDVETNGLRKVNDDLLSLSIYDPTTGMCYNRYFPLDLQPLVLTSFIHGITDDTLSDENHITQEEMDWLYEYFHLRDRVLLSFSGGQGNFDSSFVINYCKRHGVKGFGDLKFENIKNKAPKTPFGCEGQLTKDNLCRIFNIHGVTTIHSSYNDCILQWKLFEKLDSECVFFINEHLFKYTPEYIIPYSYLFKHPELPKYANIVIPSIRGKVTEIFTLDFPRKILRKIRKFPTNITGITIEHGINAHLNAIKQDNARFLSDNRIHLKYVGSLNSKIKEIPIIAEENGDVVAVRPEDVDYINKVNKLIVEHIKPVADFLKNKIFCEGTIMTQELCVSEDHKVLSLCDLSDNNNIVEIKTTDVLDYDGMLRERIAQQLYYQAKGRNPYLLSIKFESHLHKRTHEILVDDLKVYLYKVELFEFNKEEVIIERKLLNREIQILQEIQNNNFITKSELCHKLNMTNKSLNRHLKSLEDFKYLQKSNLNSRRVQWVLLRTPEDSLTKYKLISGEIVIL